MKNMMLIIGYLAIALMALGSWLTMFSGKDTASVLSSRGLNALQFYTVDSNVLMGVAALIYVLFGGNAFSKIFLLIGTATVTLTFLTTVCFLLPVMRYEGLFRGTNLFMHLIVPVLAVVLLIYGRNCAGLRFRNVLWSALPTGIYSVFYLWNVIHNGAEKDWYGLARGGEKTYPFVMMVFIGITILIASVLWLASGGLSNCN